MRPVTPTPIIGGVYFLEAPQACLIKIGISRHIHSRVGEVQRHSPVPLILLGVIERAQPFLLERWLHDRYADLREHAEWFRSSPELRALASGDHETITGLTCADAARALGVPESVVREACRGDWSYGAPGLNGGHLIHGSQIDRLRHAILGHA